MMGSTTRRQSSGGAVAQQLCTTRNNNNNNNNNNDNSNVAAPGDMSSMSSAAGRCLRPPSRSPLASLPGSPARAAVTCTRTQSGSQSPLMRENLSQENCSLQKELVAVRASLSQALRQVEMRELECVELHIFVDKLLAELNKVKAEAKEKSNTADAAQEEKEFPKSVVCRSINSQKTKAVNGLQQSPGKNNIKSKQGLSCINSTNCLSAEELKPNVRYMRSSTASATADPSASLTNITMMKGVAGEGASQQELLSEERDRLVEELARTKIVVAEQESVLDRLGIHFPYPSAMVGAARRTIHELEPLQKPLNVESRPLLIGSMARVNGSRRK